MPFRQETATTTAAQLVPFNSRRSALTIRNASGAVVYISNDVRLVTAQGWPLAVGDFTSFIKADGDDSAAAVYAQTLAATSDLRIQESFGKVSGLE